ncbi:MAG: carbohydrate kinase family protein [bacterium]
MNLFGNKSYDIVCIGDIVTDAFIRLKDANVHCKIDQTACELCVRFGDKVPFESSTIVRAVGNSANAAVSASRLGLSTGLMSVVGNDEEGKKCLETLKENNVGTAYMETDPKLPTNYHYVLWYDVERTILVNHSPFERHIPKNFKAPKWIYLTSLGENTEAFHHEITAWLKAHPETKLVFQPGTFQMKLGKEHLADIYKMSELFFCNVEEAQRILGTQEADKKTLMNMLAGLGPKIVVMTDGINGAYARDTDGTCYFMPVYPHDPYERTGAGDAFASTVVSALALGKDLKTALTWGPINSMSVVQKIGAQAGLLPRKELEDYLSKAPEDYKLKTI